MRARRNTYIVAGLLLATMACCVGAAKPKGASLTLKARFNATSYLLEGLEFLADEGPALVWTFLDRISESGGGDAGLDDEACWQNITGAVAELVSPSVGKECSSSRSAPTGRMGTLGPPYLAPPPNTRFVYNVRRSPIEYTVRIGLKFGLHDSLPNSQHPPDFLGCTASATSTVDYTDVHAFNILVDPLPPKAVVSFLTSSRRNAPTQLIPLTLASRQYAAKLQMIRQLAEQFHPAETAPGSTSCCFVSVDGAVAATPTMLAALLAGDNSSYVSFSASEQLFSFDHVYRGGAGSSAAASSGGETRPRVAILYGSPGLPCFAPLYQQLRSAADSGQGASGLTVAFRPLLSAACEPFSGCARVGTGGQLLLPGWGVEAALKNTEYSAMDEKEAKQQRQQQGGGGSGEDAGEAEAEFGAGDAAVVKGFRLDVLAARRPALRQELLTFRDQLVAADDDEAALKVWDLRDVGLQVTQRILGSSDPLALLAELSQNFPGIVSSLSRQSVSSSLRSSVAHNQQFVSAGANFLLLNGLAVDVNNLDFFGFLARLRSEMRLRDTLVGPPLALSPGLAQQVMALRAEEGGAAGGEGGGGESEPRLSLGSSSSMSKHVAFLNDLDKDPRMQRYGRNLGELLNTFPGRLRPLARNVFTSVLVTEPLCASALELALNIDRMWQGGYPIRFGVSFHLPSVVSRLVQQRKHPHLASGLPPTWQEMDATERFGRGFATLKEAFGPAAAWRMWLDAAEVVTSGYYSDPGEVVETAFSSAWSTAARSPPPGARAKAAARKAPAEALKMLKEGTGYAAEVGMQLTESASWLLARGLVQPPAGGAEGAAERWGDDGADRCSAEPVVWLNGLTGRAGGSSPAEELMYKVMGEMQRLQEAIYYGRLDDSSAGGDVLAAVLALHGAVDRLNTRIVGPQARNAQVLSLAPLLQHPAHATLHALSGDSGEDEEDDSVARVAAVTHFVAADLGSEEGRTLVAEALRFLSSVSSSSSPTRLVLVSNPASPSSPPSLLELTVQAALEQATREPESNDKVVSFLTRLLGDSPLVVRLAEELVAGSAEEAAAAFKYAADTGLNSSAIMSYVLQSVDELLTDQGTAGSSSSPSTSYRAAQSDLCRSVLRLEPGAAAVISNGRMTPVYKPGGESYELLAEDLALLQMVTGGGVGAAVARALRAAHQAEGGIGAIQGLPAGLDTPSAAAADALSELSGVVTSVLGAAARAAAHAEGGGGVGAGSRGMGPGASQQLQQMMGHLKGQALEVIGGPDAPFHLEAVLNPLSRPAQRLSGLLLLLRAALGPSMSLTLNPQRDITEMPLKSYYRYALPSGLSAAAAGVPSVPPGLPVAYFSRLPSRRVLTLNLDAPESWLLEPAAALHDLDNLRLEDVAGEVAFAEFELDALMLTGSCVDVTASGRMTPPRGLQLHLGTPSQPHIVDTLVMANLAYFQLKAAPGRWLLSLAPGRSQELYQLQSSTGTSLEAFADEEEEGAGAGAGGAGSDAEGGSGDDVSTQVLISSFLGKHMILRVRKRPGMEAEDVLQADSGGSGSGQDDTHDAWAGDLEDDEYDDDDDKPPPPPPPSGGLLGKVSSLLTGGGSKQQQAKDKDKAPKQLRGGDVINVFTVASGHMYERLQKIMILSVLRHTKSRVKFWIIKNYMSPQHKQVIPALAEQFGFEYEFVTYKWPHWLHKQTDKQRLIWAYKILFLDVLFPLGVDRIIFVDSDQVVRADLAELYHRDIKGAPYAYTPFCDNNKEMDEYRFWNGGFWRDHLQGKPYHISALYLVDLKRFRQIAAGDQLRVVYDQLSKDPNSLANLDQDLPNYAQHSIRIHSLPQEWLWCESWCGNATKAKAKTIDLCNNPKTKEPKLTAARRIIGPLWEELDAQQEQVTRAVQRMLEASEEAEAVLPGPGTGIGLASGEEQAAVEGVVEVEVETADEEVEVEVEGAPSHGDKSEL